MLEGKVKCIKNGAIGSMRVDNIYKFVNGRFIRDDGTQSLQYDSIKEFNNRNIAKIKLLNFTKSDLKDGDYVTERQGIESIVSLKFQKLLNTNGEDVLLTTIDDSLKCTYPCKRDFDIMKVERDGIIIWEREERSQRDIEIDNIQAQMEELNKKLDELRKAN